MGQQEPELHEIHIEYLYDGKPKRKIIKRWTFWRFT